MLNKLNMVIGMFLVKLGRIAKIFISFDTKPSEITQNLIITNESFEKEFLKICKSVKEHTYNIDSKRGDLEDIRNFLNEKRHFLLNLLGNPNLLEHDSFTNLLWAVFSFNRGA